MDWFVIGWYFYLISITFWGFDVWLSLISRHLRSNEQSLEADSSLIESVWDEHEEVGLGLQKLMSSWGCTKIGIWCHTCGVKLGKLGVLNFIHNVLCLTGIFRFLGFQFLFYIWFTILIWLRNCGMSPHPHVLKIFFFFRIGIGRMIQLKLITALLTINWYFSDRSI